MFIPYTKYRKIYFAFSTILIIGSISVILAFGLKPGIDFTGGSIMELEYKDSRPSVDEVTSKIKDLDLGSFSVQPAGDKNIIIRTKDISEDIHVQLKERLGVDGVMSQEIRFESIGGTIGKELKNKTIIIVGLSFLAIVIYIAISFRRIQRPLKSWQYGVASLVALFHDILIPLGFFAYLGKFYNVEISIPIITALLTILGASINNTIVVFDRIRENIFKGGFSFEDVVDKSLNQTLVRQLNTSLATLFPILAIFFFGGSTLKYFALALILGIISGMYSSFFIASPIMVSWLNWKQKRSAIDKGHRK